MKSFACLFLFVALARAVPLAEEVVPLVPATDAPVVVEAEAPHLSDPSVLLSEPIDKATKLIIDLDEHIRKYLPAEDDVLTTVAPAIVYAVNDVESVEEVNVVERQNQVQSLIDQVNRLAESIENTITDLVSRRRYVTAAMLRSMLNYVRRVRINLERLQNRLQSVANVASVQGAQDTPAASGTNTPSNVPGAQFIQTIRDRVNRITEEIGALVSRIRGSFTPGVNPNSPGGPLPPLVISAPGQLNGQGLIAGPGSVVDVVDAAVVAGIAKM